MNSFQALISFVRNLSDNTLFLVAFYTLLVAGTGIVAVMSGGLTLSVFALAILAAILPLFAGGKYPRKLSGLLAVLVVGFLLTDLGRNMFQRQFPETYAYLDHQITYLDLKWSSPDIAPEIFGKAKKAKNAEEQKILRKMDSLLEAGAPAEEVYAWADSARAKTRRYKKIYSEGLGYQPDRDREEDPVEVSGRVARSRQADTLSWRPAISDSWTTKYLDSLEVLRIKIPAGTDLDFWKELDVNLDFDAKNHIAYFQGTGQDQTVRFRLRPKPFRGGRQAEPETQPQQPRQQRQAEPPLRGVAGI